jgi:4-carboxymuconolactone decarboxylase
MRPLGAGILSHGSLPPRVRELLILRTCARCGADYEWSVHVTAFAALAGLEEESIERTALEPAEAIAAREDEEALILRVADELHDHSTLSQALFEHVVSRHGAEAVLEMAAVCGFYHLISFLIRTAGVEREPWSAPFPGFERSGLARATPGL